MSYSESVPFVRFYSIILCTTYFISANCEVWTEQFPKNVNRFRREANCSQGLRLCKTDECVTEDAFCDGKEDCKDGSDEDDCNNNQHVKKLIREPPSPNHCVVPANFPNGFYKLSNESPAEPGSFAAPFTALIVVCNRRYNMSPPKASYPICFNGKWSSSPPICALACDTVESTPTTNITCKFNGLPLENCNNPVDGVEATVLCADSHEEPGRDLAPFRLCKNGSWDNTFPKCHPRCGHKRLQPVYHIPTPPATRSDYPWHVGIYKASDKEYMCGGSIIQDDVVISVAHCFSNLNNGKPYPAEDYLVAAGKYFRTYDDSRDASVQYSDVNAIYIPERYRGQITQFGEDIAVLKLKSKFKFSSVVQPVCIDWSNRLEHEQPFGDQEGVVIGWEQSAGSSETSEELIELFVPVIPYERCFEEVPKDFRRYLTHDKICTGRSRKGPSYCQSGGAGLVLEDTYNRFYLRGVLSTSPATPQQLCDPDQSKTYTLVSTHIEFIKDKIK